LGVLSCSSDVIEVLLVAEQDRVVLFASKHLEFIKNAFGETHVRIHFLLADLTLLLEFGLDELLQGA
jgi:hypothetical protein